MLVIDANEVSGAPVSPVPLLSPVLHPAVHNVLEGLKEREDLEVEVVYGKRSPAPEEFRTEGAIRYVPISYKTFPLPGLGGPYASRLIALLAHLRKSKPDIVHAQGTEREAGMVAALSGLPAVLTLHGNFRAIARLTNAPLWSYCGINSYLESFILPRVNGVICISQYTKDLVQPANDRTWLLPNPAASSFFDISRHPVQGRIVCLGMIEERKNQTRLIEACDILASQGLSFDVQFWGPIHPEREYDREFLDQVSMRSWASYCGNAQKEQIPEILSQASILTLPSLEDNCPMVVIEAMAAGIPVVASRVGGVPDLVEHGRTGLLHPPNDAAAMADALVHLLSDAPFRDRLSQTAKEEAKARFQPSAVAAAHAKIYQELAGRH